MRWTFFFVAIAVAAALCACAQILGITDVELRDGGNAGDTGSFDGSAIDDGGDNGDGAVAPCVLCKPQDDGPCAMACNQLTPDGVALDQQGGLVYFTTKGEADSPNEFDGGGVWRVPLDMSSSPSLIENEFAKHPSAISFSQAAGVAAYSLGDGNTIRLTDGGLNGTASAVNTNSPGPITVSISPSGAYIFYISGGPPGTLYQHLLGPVAPTPFSDASVNGVVVRQNLVGYTTSAGDVITSPIATGLPMLVTNTGSIAGSLDISSDGSLIAWGVTAAKGGSASVYVADVETASNGRPVWQGASVWGLRFESSRNDIYITDHDNGRVFRVDADGSNQILIADQQNHPSAIDVGGSWIVWANDGDGNASGSIMRRRIQ